MEIFKRLTSNAVFGIQVLIAFIVLFENQITIPLWLQTLGRFHLVLLHFPIGLFVLTALLVFTRKYFESESFNNLISFLLHVTSIAASLSAVMGLLLSFEGGYDSDLLGLHKWLGLTLSFFCWILLMVSEDKFAFKPLVALGVILLIMTGHFGANLTHGEDYLFGPLSQQQPTTKIITDSTTVYDATVATIFERKCISCHNEQKAKGKLLLTSVESALKGGKNGSLWKPGNAEHSLLVKRLTFPLEHKDHMPPKDKAQLSETEIAFINSWIDRGADVHLTLKQLSKEDTLKQLSDILIASYQPVDQQSSVYKFSFVSNEKLSKLSIPNRSVFQLSANEPALCAEFYLSGSFEKKYLEELREVKEQIISINLSKMPIEDEDLKTIADFSSLEKLVLNNTAVDGSGFKYIQKLNRLKLISLAGTKIKVEYLKMLGAMKNLEEVHLWNTPVNESEIQSLQKEFPLIAWDAGYKPDAKELLQLSPPYVRNDGQVLNPDEGIVFKHNLPGAEIRYALNDEKIDSVKSEVFKKAIDITNYSLVKVKAFKDGWRSSNVAEFIFFKKGIKPLRAELKSTPNQRYAGDGIETLIDGKKGMPDFYRDPVWMAFREEPLQALFFFDGRTTVKNVTLSFAKNIGAMCMPPSELQVWAGANEENLKLIKKVVPTQPTDYVNTRIEGVSVDIPESTFACYKIVATPLAKLPAFRKAPKDRGWLMVDEIFFN